MTSPIRPVIGNTDCCFNHAIGLPTKYVSEVGEDTPLRLFDYEKMLYQSLYQYKHLWIKRSEAVSGASRTRLHEARNTPTISIAIILLFNVLFAISCQKPITRIDEELVNICLYCTQCRSSLEHH